MIALAIAITVFWPQLIWAGAAAIGLFADLFKQLETYSPGLAGIVGTVVAAAIVGSAILFRKALFEAFKCLRKLAIHLLGATEHPPQAVCADAPRPMGTVQPIPAADSGSNPPVVVVRVEQPPLPQAPATADRKPSNLPGSIGHLFKGREAFLVRLRESFALKDAAAITAKAVHGLGGLGKTRAAIEYAHSHAADYSATLFLGGKSGGDLRDGLAALAGTAVLDLPEKDIPDIGARADAVIGWLRAHPGWLLIIDNVDDPEAAAAAGMLLDRVGDSGHVLITSRIGDWGHRVEAVDLDLLSLEAAKDLLLASTPRRTKTDDEDEALTRLAQEQLGCLSLALVQAAAYIEEKRIGFAEYSTLFEREAKALLAKLGEAAARNLGYDFPVAATWQASFAQLGDAGRLLLDMLAWLSIEPIPRGLFDVWPDENIDLGAGLEELTRYSLVHWEEGNSAITLHRLVAQVTRDNMDDARRDRALAALFPWIHAVNPEMNARDSRCWPKMLPLLPHVLPLFERTNELGPYALQTFLYDHYATLLQALARYSDAERLFRRALAIDEAIYGPDHPAVSPRLNNLSGLLIHTDRFDEAEEFARRALKIGEEQEETMHPWMAARLVTLATALLSKGKLEEAEPLYRKAIEIDEFCFGSDHPEVALDLCHLAKTLVATKRPDEAERLYYRALDIYETSLGDDHVLVANCLIGIAYLFFVTEKYIEALPFYRRAALILLRSSITSGHFLPDTANVLRFYSITLTLNGCPMDEALASVTSVMREGGFDPDALWPQVFGSEE